jgi:exodeoxyribonuclease VIII
MRLPCSLARAKEFDIYNVPFEIDIQANGIMNKLDNKEWLATRELFMSIPGGRDFRGLVILLR